MSEAPGMKRTKHTEQRSSMTTTTLDARKTLGAGALTTRFEDALQFAFQRHRFHFRKGSRVPYFSHLMSVCALVLEHGGSEDQAIAALLHDAVEDAAEGRGWMSSRRSATSSESRFGRWSPRA